MLWYKYKVCYKYTCQHSAAALKCEDTEDSIILEMQNKPRLISFNFYIFTTIS